MAEQLQAVNTRLEGIAGKLQDLSGAFAGEIRDSFLRVDKFVEEFQGHCRKNLRELNEQKLKTEFEDFMFKNSTALEDEFHAKNNFTTTIRGIKVRGVFGSDVEATARAKKLQRSDPNFNIYMGSVGKWMAWEPDASKVGEQEYANEQLNTLMKKYRENEDARDSFYTEQKAKRIGTARTKDAGDESVNTVDTEVAVSASMGGGAYDAMFSGPADLAIQRKMEKQ